MSTYWQRVFAVPPLGHIARTVGSFVGGLLFLGLLFWLLSGLSIWQFIILCLLMRG